MRVLFFPTSFDGLATTSPSIRYRCELVTRYWEEAEVYNGTQFPREYDVWVFQKYYLHRQAQELAWQGLFYSKMMVFDLCDPVWMESERQAQNLLGMLPKMDFATTPNEFLQRWLKRWLPTRLIPDREDLSEYKKVKRHWPRLGRLRGVWFGYSHNYDPLTEMLPSLKAMGVEITAVSDQPYPDPYVKFVQWSLATVNDVLLAHDIAILPRMDRGKYLFKSENRRVKAMALGLPVAEELWEVEVFKDWKARRREASRGRAEAEELWDVHLSVCEWREAIDEAIGHLCKLRQVRHVEGDVGQHSVHHEAG